MTGRKSERLQGVLETALTYAQHGWAVFPVNGKKPFEGTRGFKDATVLETIIRGWWNRWPSANIGLPTGALNGLFVVDIDGFDGERALRALEEKHGPLPATYTVRTGRGRHLYFRQPLGILVKCGVGILGPKIDVRGDGGYVVASPSIHPKTKRPYEVVVDGEPVEAPPWLVEIVSFKKEQSTGNDRPLKQISEGARNSSLTSLAGKLRRAGLSQTEIESALLSANEGRCIPPLGRSEVLRIAQSISRYSSPVESPPLTDAGNARRFAVLHGASTRYVADRKKYFAWDGRRWVEDDATGAPMTCAKATARSIAAEAATEPDDKRRADLLKWALHSESRARLDAMVALARDEHPIRVRTFHEIFDRHLMLLNVNNGTIDLSTGKLRPHRREDYITKMAPVDHDPDAVCARFNRFLLEVMQEDVEMVAYIWRVLGYALTGNTRERVVFLLYGEGANGKTTLIERFANVLGDYAHSAPFKEFLQKIHDGASNEIAQLQGKRFVYSVEPPSGRGFDEAILKQLSGQDKVRARSLYLESIEWKPELKLFLAANHRPQIRETTNAIWDRVRLIPFLARFEGSRMDRELATKLDAELPGILAAAVRGCLDWQQHGLCQPDKVQTATTGYRHEMNEVDNFLEEKCAPGEKELTGDLYRTYQRWAYEQGVRFPIKIKAFSQELERLGHPRLKSGGQRYHQGLTFIESKASSDMKLSVEGSQSNLGEI